jgi:hypothetical protein
MRGHAENSPPPLRIVLRRDFHLFVVVVGAIVFGTVQLRWWVLEVTWASEPPATA